MSFGNTKTPTKPTVKAKWQVPQRPCNRVYVTKKGKQGVLTVPEYYLEGKLLDKFCKLFPIHSNRRIMEWFGISFSTLQRFKRELGLTKNMRAVRKELAADVKVICENNGYYDSLKGKPPSEQCFKAIHEKFASGWHPMKVLKKKNRRKYERLMAERSERRKRLIRMERRRVSLGLTPKTHLTPMILLEFRPFTKAEIYRRSKALKRGYILGAPDTERYVIFYDSDTDRGERFETDCTACGFQVRPLPKE